MAGKDSIRIGCASAFWGDTETAAAQLVRGGEIDYLVLDFLSEITMSILAAKRRKDPAAGYAEDFVRMVAPLLGEIVQNGIKVVTNAGGINPESCRRALEEAARKQDVRIGVAVVEGDDLKPNWAQLVSSERIKPFEQAEQESPPFEPESANAYLGAEPIRCALAHGADIIVTGRCVDSALALGPLLHEFGWQAHDHDKLAAGSLAGHLIECGTQATGGNFTDWELVSDGYENMGFPIAEVSASGALIITKPPGTGGIVTPHTVGEQLLYEIGDPRAYFLPDVTCDFSDVKLEQAGPDRVSVSGARGLPPTNDYKVSATFRDGYRSTALFMLVGKDAVNKARRVIEAILHRAENLIADKGFSPFRDARGEVLGAEDVFEGRAREGASATREVVVRIAVRHDEREALQVFAREIAQASTAMAPGITGYFGGRPAVSPVIRLYSGLVGKEHVPATVRFEEKEQSVRPPKGGFSWDLVAEQAPATHPKESAYDATVPLRKLALARSGDKGDHANIGVIARDPDYVKYIRDALTEEAVAGYFSHFVEGDVSRWELKSMNAFNFLLRNALGGGGIASLHVDSQGKGYAQMLLDYPVPVPNWLSEPPPRDGHT